MSNHHLDHLAEGLVNQMVRVNKRRTMVANFILSQEAEKKFDLEPVITVLFL